jgi:hypothetical protein
MRADGLIIKRRRVRSLGRNTHIRQNPSAGGREFASHDSETRARDHRAAPRDESERCQMEKQGCVLL